MPNDRDGHDAAAVRKLLMACSGNVTVYLGTNHYNTIRSMR